MYVSNSYIFEDDGHQVRYVESTNKSLPIRQVYLMMHYTAGVNIDSTIDWFQQRKSKVSAHIVIGSDGEVVQMVPFNRKAWHAGTSKWKGLSSLNKYSIGIELVNAGKLEKRHDGSWISWSGRVIPDDQVIVLSHKNESKETGWQLYPEVQVQKAIEVAMALNEKYEFSDVLGHDDVAPDRKVDPGPAFPMRSFRSIVLGRKGDE